MSRRVALLGLLALASCKEDFPIGGTVVGLAPGNSFILELNGDEHLYVHGSGEFVFHTRLPRDSTYLVAMPYQPAYPPQTCSLANAAGRVSGPVTNLEITCSAYGYTVGGTVSGLDAGETVNLYLNGAGPVPTASGPFLFDGLVYFGDSYTVLAMNGPKAKSCQVQRGEGASDGPPVTDVLVVCGVARVVGGTVSGLLPGAWVALNLNDYVGAITVSSDGPFAFPASVGDGSTYAVTVGVQPSTPPEVCVVASGTGTIAGVDVDDVAVSCSPPHTVGGTVSGLVAGASVALRLNGDQGYVIVPADGAFAFTTGLGLGAAYAVTIGAQPTSPPETCVVENGEGTMVDADVADVLVTCAE